ncbi:MAG: helix-turn-helix domain-containing protein [Pseudobdellovibrionaceae bacterium]
MVWDREKIRDLRLRMGWSQSDLARRLQVEANKITEIEMGLQEPQQDQLSGLDLLLKQAEASADGMACDSLAEIVFDEDEVLQVDTSSIRRKFLDQ